MRVVYLLYLFVASGGKILGRNREYAFGHKVYLGRTLRYLTRPHHQVSVVTSLETPRFLTLPSVVVFRHGETIVSPTPFLRFDSCRVCTGKNKIAAPKIRTTTLFSCALGRNRTCIASTANLNSIHWTTRALRYFWYRYHLLCWIAK